MNTIVTPLTPIEKEQAIGRMKRRPLPAVAMRPKSSLPPTKVDAKFPLENTGTQEPQLRLAFSARARGERALEKVAGMTSKQASVKLKTTPRQIRRARKGEQAALVALSRHVTIKDMIDEAETAMNRMQLEASLAKKKESAKEVTDNTDTTDITD